MKKVDKKSNKNMILFPYEKLKVQSWKLNNWKYIIASKQITGT